MLTFSPYLRAHLTLTMLHVEYSEHSEHVKIGNIFADS